jgi:sugar lactone lactonase YvrE
MVKIECVVEAKNWLGEGPVWDVKEGALYWVDMLEQEIWRYEPTSGKTKTWKLPKVVGAFSMRERGGAVITMRDGFYFFDPETGETELIQEVDADEPRSMFNDGKVDRAGRFFAGGEDEVSERAMCGLFRLDADLSVHELERGIICNNGPCWSPDNKTFYHTDSFKQSIYAYDYDFASGDISNKRVFASSEEERGVFDGSTVDEEGYIWNARFMTGELVRHAPDGTIERRIDLPVPTTTSVMFGGDNLDEAYITSMARIDWAGPTVREHFPGGDAGLPAAAGNVFKVTGLGVRGLHEHRFAG